MKHNRPTFPASFAVPLAFALLAALLALPARSADPNPDNKTLIFPVLVPKSGHGTTPPADSASGLIRNAYETVFEPYWRETSYFDYDIDSGAKLQGFYVDTKTYGYSYAPWPLNDRNGRPAPFFGSDANLFFASLLIPEGSGAPPPTGAAPWMIGNGAPDIVWTPGEAFEDINGDREWTDQEAGALQDDFWNVDNNSPFRVNSCNNLLPVRLDGANGDDWSDSRGEFYADYDGGTVVDGAGNVTAVDFDTSVTIYVADESLGYNVPVVLNELDITPTSCPGSNEGDFEHIAVENGDAPAITDIPLNDRFDFTVDAGFNPRVVAATTVGGANAVVTYQSYRYEDDGTPYTAAAPPPTGEGERVVSVQAVEVQIYQTSELFGEELATPTGLGIYGDPNGNPGEDDPARDEDGTWTPENPGTPAEPFEDFISWWDPIAEEFTYLIDPNGLAVVYQPDVLNGGPNPFPADDDNDNLLEGHPLRNPSRGTGVGITIAEYEDYIRWNYPGDAQALIDQALNGVYDGPDAYSLTGTSQLQQFGFLSGLVTSDPNFQWDARTFASWTDWWTAYFGSPAPAWNESIPFLTVYEAVVVPPPDTNEPWIPWSGTWGYNGEREFADLPSSLYYLQGGAAGAVPPVDLLGIPGGDGNLGESTSPFSDSIYGEDLGAPLPSYPLNNSGPDGIIPSGGPFNFNVHGTSGYDAGNMLNLEMLTRWYQVPAAVSGLSQADMIAANPHPSIFKDRNLDGMVDHGALNTVEPNYATGRQTTESDGNMLIAEYPYNNARVVEAMAAAWDQSEDFDSFRQPNPPNAQVGIYYFPIYPSAPGPGSASLGGTSGQTVAPYTRDRASGLPGFLQVRPMTGATLGGSEGFESPGSFTMQILAHEQGHDLLGWPDLYDYDTWSGGGEHLNWPVGSYDLMSDGSMVHGIPDMKGDAGWLNIQDLKSILIPNEGPQVVEMYPITRDNDQYFIFENEDAPGEYFFVWYADNNTDFGVAGGPGIYISHTDLGGNPDALPNQQRQNNHFIYELVQADGMNELQDGINRGNAGDPFPGTSNKYYFTESTIPAARWWDQSESGLRILDIELPADPQEPALVTMEWVDPHSGTFIAPVVGEDVDGDGIPDPWEFYFFGDLDTADGTSDYRNDGITDREAFLMDLDPTKINTNFFAQDLDGDGLTDLQEIRDIGSDNRIADTDDDGLLDGDPAETDPLNSLFPPRDRVLTTLGVSDTYVVAPEQERFHVSDSFSLQAWVYPRVYTGDLFSRVHAGGTVYDYRVSLLGSGQVQFLFTANDGSGPVSVNSIQDLPLEQWTHVAVVYNRDLGQMQIFFNGIQAGSRFTKKVPAFLPGVGSPRTRIGDGTDALIDEVAIFDAALTLDEIRATLDGIGLHPVDDLVAYYRFDDGTSAGWDPVDSRWENTSDMPDWLQGQVEDFSGAYPEDWKTEWENGGTFVGENISVIDAPDGSPVMLSERDSNGDGIPDWWYIQYGFDPTGPSVAYQDNEDDGVWNLIEYQLGTHPFERDSDGNGVSDADEDNDGDSLTNLYEQTISGTDIDSADTDDDGLTDWEEVTGQRVTELYHDVYNAWIDGVIPAPPDANNYIDTDSGVSTASNPLSSLSPEKDGFLALDGTGLMTIPDQPRHNLRSWTLEAWVSPAMGADGGRILRRTVTNPYRTGIGVNYEMGVEPNGTGGLRAYALYRNIPVSGTPTEVRLDGVGAEILSGVANFVPRVNAPNSGNTGAYPNGWTHVAATYDAENLLFILYINGREVSRIPSAAEPVGLGLDQVELYDGTLTVGEDFEGRLDNIQIYGGASSAATILASANGENLFADAVVSYEATGNLASTGGAFSPLSPSVAASKPHVPGQVMVRFKPEFTAVDKVEGMGPDLGLSIRKRFSIVPMYLMNITDGESVEQKLTRLAGDVRVEFAEPNYKVERTSTPNDPKFVQQYALRNNGQTGGTAGADIDAPTAWAGRDWGGNRVKVAVIDTGIDYTHPDIWANMWTGIGYDFVNDSPDPMDLFADGHGTHVAGTIGAVGNNGIGITGVAWRTELMALKALENDFGTTDSLVAAIQYAVAQDAKISNNSWGGNYYSQTFHDVIRAAGEQGHLFITSAGNDNLDVDANPVTPAGLNLPNMIVVAASDHNDDKADFSNYGTTAVHLAAPGVDILSTLPGAMYGEFSGTSMASPHVAGVAALIMSQNPHLDVRAVRNLILSSVDPVAGWDQYVATGGRLNAGNALAARGALVGYFNFNDFGESAEDFSYSQDWKTDWSHAGVLAGDARVVSFSGVVSQPVADCVLTDATQPLDAYNYGWETWGWTCDTERADTGSLSVRAGGLIQNGTTYTPILGDNQVAYLQTYVIGPGVVSFSASWGTEEALQGHTDNADNFRFRIRHSIPLTVNGWNNPQWGTESANGSNSNYMPPGTDVTELGWDRFAYAVPPGVIMLRWEYRKDGETAQYPDAIWVDDVSFTHTGPDSDGDGIPDAYETHVYSTDPFNSDTDGDKVLDGVELEIGTNPLVAEATTVDAVIPGGLQWTGIGGVEYMVQRTEDMVTWVQAHSSTGTDEQSRRRADFTGQTLTYLDPDPDPPATRVYRVIILTP